MQNERLLAAVLRADVSLEELADACGTDRKTVERWIGNADRAPHRRNARAAAQRLGVPVEYLWPRLKVKIPTGADDRQPELVCTYPDRASVPRDVWIQLVTSATCAIDILVFSGTFLAQTNPRLPRMLTDRAASGARVRLCFGQPDGSAVASRDLEEGLAGTLGPKIRASLSYFKVLSETANCELRLHNTTLYASIFRYDDQAMINPHIWGAPASANPIQQVRRTDDDCLFDKYLDSFDRVWDQAKPWYEAT